MEHRNNTRENTFIRQIGEIATPIQKLEDLAPLFEKTEDKKYVLLGEASHGTHEFYAWRREISKYLIEKQGFSFVAVEGDWPDCYRVNRYVKGYPDSGHSAYEVLHAFNRWPTWMWANQEMVEFIEWLKVYNKDLPNEKKVGFYGLDVYSLWDSLYSILRFLKKKDPEAIEAAIRAYHCFEPYGEDPQQYARALMFVPVSCQKEVVALLKKIREKQPQFRDDPEEVFSVEQNAIVVHNAEHYYRTMIQGGVSSWNVRDSHMVETLNRLMKFHGKNAKGIVWAHNTHIGDARYTDMAAVGEYNIGQLIREQNGEENSFLVGFSSYKGKVIASIAWDMPMEEMKVPEAIKESWEELLHRISKKDSLLLFADKRDELKKEFFKVRGHRAIGVVYNPEHEYGNYVPTILPQRYDALLYFDTTNALSPLHMRQQPDQDFPQTYPWAV